MASRGRFWPGICSSEPFISSTSISQQGVFCLRFQRISSLPDDPNFSQTDNKYNEASYRRLCADFGVNPTSDFRFNHGQNHGLGYIFINYSDGDFAQKQSQYPTPLSNLSNQRFSDEGGTDSAGNKLDYIRNDQGADGQFEYFVSDSANGLTSAGLARLNQSIEAFVYCIFGCAG